MTDYEVLGIPPVHRFGAGGTQSRRGETLRQYSRDT
jgi:hypothetical protein